MSDAESLVPGFMIIHGNRLEGLRQLVVNWVARYPLGPLENDVVLVQSNGIAQWLKQALAADVTDDETSGCGIAAAFDVKLPARFLWDAYRGVLGAESVPASSSLDKAPLTWRLMRLLPAVMHEPVFEPLQRFLADDQDCRKRYQLAERLADLFDQYQVYRADWLGDWAAGHDQIRHAREGVKPLEPADCWQPALWRALLQDVGEARLADSRAGIHPRFVSQLAELSERPAGLPRRVIVFGISSLPAQTLEALAAIGRFSQVLLCVLNPCQHHWGNIVGDQDLLRHQYQRQQRRPGSPLDLDENSLHQHAHPLLAAWGKQGRDYINLLDSHDERASYEHQFQAINGGRIDLFDEPDTVYLLGQLQSDILDLRPLAETRVQWPPVMAQDQSICFHLAHSAQREVEILHDQLLAWFNADPSLKPRDIIVMVPDVNAYAPSVQAVFGQYTPDDKRYIPFTLADQGQRGIEPLLIALESLLRLPDSRLPVSEVLSLLDVPALRARFGIQESELPTLRRWIEGAGIRWGMHAESRAALGLPGGLEANTWRFGLRRMLLGYAVGAGDPYAGIEPYDEIGGLDAALIGPLVALLEALDQACARLAEPAPAVTWGVRMRALLEDFLLPAGERDERLLGQLDEAMDQWLELCAGVELNDDLPLNVVREAWLSGVEQSQLGQRFLAGAVNVCTLMPMRAIPFRRICLLGMNDGDYPRAQPPLDFDLMARDYRPGDRSRREDDRYLLLEALLSARERLYVSWVGRSIHDNSERPASVLVGQLRDHLTSGWRAEHDEALLAMLTLEHPLQPFSKDYFQGDEALFSYAHEWLPMHGVQGVGTTAARLSDLLPDAPIEVEQLQRFLRNPAVHFFTGRLKVFLDERNDSLDDHEPFALDALQNHQLSETLLQACLPLPAEQDVDDALTHLASRLQGQGRFPLAGFGELARSQLILPLGEQMRRFQAVAAEWPEIIDNPLALEAGQHQVQLASWLSGVRKASGSDALARINLVPGKRLGKKKSLRWRQLMADWVIHVLASASGHDLQTWVVAGDATLHFKPLPAPQAQNLLEVWLAAWLEGLSRPLPCAPDTAFAWLDNLANGEEKATQAAQAAYEGGFKLTGEVERSAALRRQYPDFASLIASGEFAELSQQLYAPLTEACRDQLLTLVDAIGEDA
ncbi:DNA helicase/exodeoxyribonuclease V, gamma subunit [Halopseudomonas litoralis]|uniref:RecBCD enzyme subunit RecC n=1 Tax=Halopseudomonas litoralis TaxID=797277 RepID=A0A1H1Y540_9GAMM|nr:exodeoxyribonuclease V subunit gamma [Halopseudomonas litoralis]SDT16618.1 DNA helicase/exodeoxyribonuclease V, gamma subunit [Halopseudomonas litoralis]